MGSTEIFYARYQDKSDLFDVYCKSSNIKVYFFTACMSRSVLFIQLIYYLRYQNYIGKQSACIFACKKLSAIQLRQFYTALKPRYLLWNKLYKDLVIKWSPTVIMNTITMFMIDWWAL